eukprot:473905-Rhodomonas_salina.4
MSIVFPSTWYQHPLPQYQHLLPQYQDRFLSTRIASSVPGSLSQYHHRYLSTGPRVPTVPGNPEFSTGQYWGISWLNTRH